MEMKEQIADEWKEYWQAQTSIPAWDYTSEIVIETLRHQCGTFEGKSILEAGCGTGRISLEIAQSGASITCVDVSQAAANHTKMVFTKASLPYRVSVASIFGLPFDTGQFDIVWNAGVLEHFSESERKEVLGELLRVVRPGGLLVTLNPYKFAAMYRIGKFISEKLGKWPYGHEDPIASLVLASQGLPCTPFKEYSTGFYVVLVEALRVNVLLLPLVEKLRSIFVCAHRSRFGGIFRASDRILSQVLGGYLLVSSFRKC